MTTLSKTSVTFRLSFTFIILMFIFNATMAQEKGTVKDSRDGHIYQWVKIGKKAWMAENLKYDAKPGSWYYNNDSANARTHGRLFTWNAAMTACPKGWILPTDGDWAILMTKLGGIEFAGGKLQEMDTLYWNANKMQESARSISSLLGGVRHSDSTFTGVALWGALWSATVNADGATNYLFVKGDKSVGKSTNDKNSAFGVRCVKK